MAAHRLDYCHSSRGALTSHISNQLSRHVKPIVHWHGPMSRSFYM